MKRIIILSISVILIFSSCSVQENVDPQVFLKRLVAADEGMSATEESVFYEGNSCVAFFDYYGKRFALEQFCTDDGFVSEICLSSESADEKLFGKCVETVIKVYAPGEESADILNNLLSEGYSYHSTQWYDYSSYTGGKTYFFSVKNKKISVPSEEKLTLKYE